MYEDACSSLGHVTRKWQLLKGRCTPDAANQSCYACLLRREVLAYTSNFTHITPSAVDQGIYSITISPNLFLFCESCCKPETCHQWRECIALTVWSLIVLSIVLLAECSFRQTRPFYLSSRAFFFHANYMHYDIMMRAQCSSDLNDFEPYQLLYVIRWRRHRCMSIFRQRALLLALFEKAG